MPLLVWICSGFGLFWLASEYIYIILVSCLLLFATIKLADALKIKREIFYVLTLTPFLLNLGLLAGPYLLAFALLELFVFCLLTKKAKLSGLLIGLAVLAHYATLIFLPLILFNKKIRSILYSFLFFVIALIPWFIFNYVKTNNFLTSFFDSYLLNIGRQSTQSLLEAITQIIIFGNYYLILAIIGIIFLVKEKRQISELFLFISFGILALISFMKIPYKNPTYLFHFTLPLVYFSSACIKKVRKHIFMFIIILIFIVNIFLAVTFISLPKNESYYKSALESTNDCMTISNEWVPVNYIGRPTQLPIAFDSLKGYVDKGYNLVYFKKSDWNSYDLDKLRKLSVLSETEDYIVIGDKSNCESYHKVEYSFAEDKYGKKFSFNEMLDLLLK